MACLVLSLQFLYRPTQRCRRKDHWYASCSAFLWDTISCCKIIRGVHPPKPIMHIAPLYEFAFITVFPQNILIFPPYFHKIYTFPPISKKKILCALFAFLLPSLL